MADSATDIDLDSVIDRLLEGGWRVPVSRSSFGSCLQRGGGCANAGLRPYLVCRVVWRVGLGRRGVPVPAQHAAVSRMCWRSWWKKFSRVEYASLEQLQPILTLGYAPVFKARLLMTLRFFSLFL